ncbi:MAG TPA: hypothetical protein VEC14_06580 [Reyranellaceae bacterium]|nr:hypothetical protein [Reyranellaceae bacterium]
MSYRLIAALLAGGLAAACATYETRTVVVPTTEDSCTVYGYTPGTEAYRLCFEREAAYRRAGRMTRADFTQARVVAVSQEACESYGLRPGSDRYERCVQREVAYRTPG